MRPLPPALALLLAVSLLAAPPALAAEQPFASPVQGSDGDQGLRLMTILTPAGFVDANGNGRLDLVQPDETLYLDLDNTRTVSFGDLRLSAFFAYAAGTGVDYANRDLGRSLEAPAGWFARSAGGAWYFDADHSRSVSAADVRLTGAAPGAKVQADDPAAGEPLEAVQATATPAVRVGWNDVNGNLQRDHGEAVYLDLNFDQQVTPGELRLRSSGLAMDDEATRAELAAAVQSLEGGDAQLRQGQQAGDAALAGQLAALGDAAAVQGQWLLILGLVNIVGLGCVAWYARHLHRQATQAHAMPAPQDRP